jgi:D-lactate dehydrogenase
MKMIAYAVAEDEKPIFAKYQEQYGVELTLVEEKPTLENSVLSQGMDCINVLSDTVITPELWDIYQKNGVRLGVTRTIGMEHMNQEYAEALGIGIRNITYSPASVADYAIMLMLMVLRHVKPAMGRYLGQDYTMPGLRGRELPNMTVGIVGAGRIGVTTLRHLTGFGCKLKYWSRTPKPELEGIAEYCDLDTLLGTSDILSLHLALSEETHHFLDGEKIKKMKDGAVLINTARGPLVDSWALIDALEQGKLRGAGLDVFDGDRYIYYRDHKNVLVGDRSQAVLNAMPNVLMLPHMAYCTDQALEDMVHNSLIAASEYFR